MTTSVVETLTARARAAAHPAPSAVGDERAPSQPASARGDCACTASGSVLADRADATVVRHGALVAKAHAPETDPRTLALRLAVAAHPALAGVLLPPLPPAQPSPDVRPVTYWPYGTPVDPDAPQDAPWEEVATLLARLHAVPPSELPGPLPPMRGPLKAARAVERLLRAGPHPATGPILRAWEMLPAWARAEVPGRAGPVGSPGALCHGDLHLGQLVRHPGPDGPWLLIDIDDLGAGEPAWDLARPAAWFACGLLPPDAWSRFLHAYRAARGPALPAAGDPWPVLEVPARALTVQTAALSVAKSLVGNRPLDEAETAIVDACDRMAPLPAELGRDRAK